MEDLRLRIAGSRDEVETSIVQRQWVHKPTWRDCVPLRVAQSRTARPLRFSHHKLAQMGRATVS